MRKPSRLLVIRPTRVSRRFLHESPLTGLLQGPCKQRPTAFRLSACRGHLPRPCNALQLLRPNHQAPGISEPRAVFMKEGRPARKAPVGYRIRPHTALPSMFFCEHANRIGCCCPLAGWRWRLWRWGRVSPFGFPSFRIVKNSDESHSRYEAKPSCGAIFHSLTAFSVLQAV